MKSSGNAARWTTGAVLIAAAILLFATIGCPGADNPAPPNAQDDSDGATLIIISAAELPIGPEMPPLDEGRVTVSYPNNWEHYPKTKGFVVRFHSGSAAKLPRILVTADDSPYEGITTVDGSNYDQLVAAVKEELGDDGKLLEAPLAMQLGDGYFVRYVSNARLDGEGAERQVLVTVLHGRRYVIDLQLRKKTMNEYKSFGYAVAASLRWLGDAPAAEGAEQPAASGEQDGSGGSENGEDDTNAPPPPAADADTTADAPAENPS